MSRTLPTGKQLVTVTAALAVVTLLFGSHAWPLAVAALALAAGARSVLRRRAVRRLAWQGARAVTVLDGRRG